MLLKAGALQNAIFNSANFSSIATDEKGVIQLFNVGAERMLGYTAAEVLNKITPAEISDPQEVIARAKALSLELETTIAPGFEALVFKASRGIEDIYELTYFRKDGSRFPVEFVKTLINENGRVVGSVLVFKDITERKRVEETIARKAAERAFGMANMKPRDIHGADVHDCFSITEIVVYEILGLAEPGKGAELAKSGATALPQVRNEKMRGKIDISIPVNAGGGLIGDGHPVGATGVRQVVEAYQQLTTQAGARQIENAKRYLTFNMGGSLTTSVAMVWGRD